MAEEIRLNITANDKGAKQLVDHLTRALTALLNQQAQSIRASARATNATRQAVESLRKQNAATREAANAARVRIASLRAEAAASIAASRASQLAAQQERSAAAIRASAARQSALAVQQNIAAIRAKAAADNSAAQSARALAQVLRNQAEAARQAARQINAANALQAAQQRSTANAAAAAARQALANTQLQIAQARAQTSANAAAAAASRTQAAAIRNQGRAAAQAAGQLNRFNRSVRGSINPVGALTRRILSLGVAFAAFRGFQRFIHEGLKFNEVVETAELGIAAIITATSDVRDPFGTMVTGAEALNTAIILAEEQVHKLRIAGLQTAATTDELVQAFQSATAAGIAAGLTLDQIRETTVRVVQAAGAIGLPMQQLEQEVRSILDATIDRNSRVARVLGITNEEVRLAKEQNRLADMLNEKLGTFAVSGERSMETWRVIKSNMAEAFQVFSGVSLETMFQQLQAGGLSFLERVFEFDEAELAEQFRPVSDAISIIADEFGDLAATGMDRILDGAERLAGWLHENQNLVREIATSFGGVLRSIGEVIAAVAYMAGRTAQVGAETNVIVELFDTLSGILSFVADLIRGVADALRSLFQNRAFTNTLLTVGAIGLAITAWLAPLVAAKALFLGIAAAVGLFLRNRKESEQSGLRELKVVADQQRAVTNLMQEYVRLQRSKKEASGEELIRLLEKENELLDKINEKHPVLAESLRKVGDEHGNTAEKVRELTDEYIKQQRVMIAAEQSRAAAMAFSHKQVLESLETGKLATLSERERNKIRQDGLEQLREQNARVRSLIPLTKELDELERQNALRGTTTGRVGDPDAEDRKKALNDLVEQIRAAIARIRNELKFTEDDLRESYETFGLSINQYFSALNREQETAANKIIALLKRIRSLQTEAGEIAKVDTEIEKEQSELGRSQIENARNMRKENEELADQIREVNVAVLRAAGQHIKAAGIETAEEFRKFGFRLDAEIEGWREQLEAADLSTPAGQAAAEAAQQMIAHFEGVKIKVPVLVSLRQVREAGEELAEGIQKVQEQVNAETISIDLMQATGLVRQEEISARIIEMYRNQLQALRQWREQYRESIADINDPSALNVAQREMAELEERIGQVEVALLQAVEAAKVLRNALRDAVTKGIETLLTTGILDAYENLKRANDDALAEVDETANAIDRALEKHGVAAQERMQTITEYTRQAKAGLRETVGVLDILEEAFRSFAYGVVQALQQVIAQMIAMRIVMASLNLLSGGISSGGGQFTPNVVAGPSFASGGFIRGPGTETSDSVPARLSRGEYVLSARTVREIGVDTLDMINFGYRGASVRRPKRAFAEGGVVETHGLRKSLDSSMTLGLEEGLVLRHLETNEGQRVLVRTVASNRAAIRRALGV